MNKKVIIFDFDGTLVDSMTGFGDIAASVLSYYHGCEPQWAKDQYRVTSGMPFPQQLEKIFPDSPSNVMAAALFDELKRKQYAQSAYFPETFDAMIRLKQEGYYLAISSNNDADLVKAKLAADEPYFDIALGFTPGFSKGHDHFEKIREVSQCSLDDMLFVGDSLHDAKMAQSYGIDFVGRAGTFSKEDFERAGCAIVIDNLEQLVQMLAHAQNTDIAHRAPTQKSDTGRWHGHPLGIPDGGLA